MQIVVVDNGSVDGSVAALRDAHPEIDVIDAGQNLGFARGVNRGVAHARGDYVLLLNPDALMIEGSLPRLMSFARDNPQYRIFGGRTLREDLTLEPSSCWGAPSLWSLTMYATMLSTVFKRSKLFDPESLGRWGRDTIREVPIITGCLLLMSRDDFDELGGMDEDFFLYGEDAEFSMRAAAHGMARIIYPPAAIIHNVGGSTSSSGGKGCHGDGRQGHLPQQDLDAPARHGRACLLLTGVALRAAHGVGQRADPAGRGRPCGVDGATGQRATRTRRRRSSVTQPHSSTAERPLPRRPRRPNRAPRR